MNKAQRAFYKSLVESLNQGDYLDVEGNFSYVFLYLYKILSNMNKIGYENLYEFLMHISEIYSHETYLSNYCISWAYDCLLGMNKFDIYLEKTEPKSPFEIVHNSDLRLNLQSHIGLEPYPIDIVLIARSRRNRLLIENQAIYKDCIMKHFAKITKSRGGWISIFGKQMQKSRRFPHRLFGGAPVHETRLSFEVISFQEEVSDNLTKIRTISTEAENLTRDILGLPRIGEGWITETKLFRLIESTFHQTKVIQHGQPIWLGKQHFDIWLPHWNIAIEYHGSQHYMSVDFFGGEEVFQKTVERDLRKANLAQSHGVKLFVVNEDDDWVNLISEIDNLIALRKVLPPEQI